MLHFAVGAIDTGPSLFLFPDGMIPKSTVSFKAESFWKDMQCGNVKILDIIVVPNVFQAVHF